MSKYLKDQITADLTRRLDGVADCVLANVNGLDSEKTFLLRKRLREKDIHVLVVKNTLARRATEGTSLGPAFEGIQGSSAIVWGGEDFVSLVKEVTELDKDEEFEEFSALGGAMDGEQLTPDRVKEISNLSAPAGHSPAKSSKNRRKKAPNSLASCNQIRHLPRRLVDCFR